MRRQIDKCAPSARKTATALIIFRNRRECFAGIICSSVSEGVAVREMINRFLFQRRKRLQMASGKKYLGLRGDIARLNCHSVHEIVAVAERYFLK